MQVIRLGMEVTPDHLAALAAVGIISLDTPPETFEALQAFVRSRNVAPDEESPLPVVEMVAKAVLGYAAVASLGSANPMADTSPSEPSSVVAIAGDILTLVADVRALGKAMGGATLIALLNEITGKYLAILAFCE